MAEAGDERPVVSGFSGYPTPKCVHIPYENPPPENNPIVRGLPLYYLSSLVAAFTPIQNFLWRNARFGALRGRDELTGVENRYDPTVIPLRGSREDSQPDPPYDVTLRSTAAGIAAPFHSIADYTEAFKSGKLTPSDVVESLLPLIRRDVSSPTKHSIAFLETKVDIVRKAAEAATHRHKHGRPLGALDGVPFATKDEFDIQGYSRCEGSNVIITKEAQETSWCIAKLEKQGAINLGKLNMHEYGMDTTNNNPNHGTPLNPYNEHYYTGGSSGGAGYAVGAGIVPFAMGTDGGGSIRIPAAYCGVYGLKPSHGRVSISPTSSPANTTVVHGPLAANMADLELSYRILATPDPSHTTSSQFDPPRALKTSRKKILGIYMPWFKRADPSVHDSCWAAVEYFKNTLGYEIVNISIPMIHEAQNAHALTILAEAATVVPDVSKLTPANKILLTVGARTPATDLMLAQKLRNVLMQHLAYLFQKYPGLIIVTPTTPNPGWHISGGQSDLKYGISDGNMSIRSMEYVWLANFTGVPCISFPIGYVDPVEGEGKIPIALSGNGEWGSEDALIEFGYDGERWLREGCEGGRRRPKSWVDVLKGKRE